MGDALTVDDEYIGLTFEFFDSGNADGCFPKGKQAGDVGEGEFAAGICCFDRFKVRQFQKHAGGDNSLAVFAKSAVKAGNKLRFAS